MKYMTSQQGIVLVLMNWIRMDFFWGYNSGGMKGDWLQIKIYSSRRSLNLPQFTRCCSIDYTNPSQHSNDEVTNLCNYFILLGHMTPF
jgi:hypothetical protein